MRIESNDLIDIATAYREAGMQNRVVGPLDDVWISAINESSSTLVSKPKYKERLTQAWENLESTQFTVGRPARLTRVTPQHVLCDERCMNTTCFVGRDAFASMGFDIDKVYCIGCPYCTERTHFVDDELRG